MVVSEVYADKGDKIGEFYELRRKVVPLNKIPKVVINAFIAAEDAQFLSHKGIDLRGILRASIKNFQAGHVVQGGSTITQQVAKSLLLTPEKKFSRKFKELVLAMRLEKNLSKEDILYLYLNEIYLGHGAYGVEAASQNYFGKSVSEITLAEAAILAGLPQAPSRYSPLLNSKAAKERQLYVLKQMVDNGYISKRESLEARDQVLHFYTRSDFNLRFAPYFVEHVRRYLVEKYGNERVLRDGLQVYTTLNLDFQKTANLAIEKGLRDLDKRQGYRGAINHFSDSKKIDTFLEEQTQKEVFEEGNVYQAIVSKVDDGAKKVGVRFGSNTEDLSNQGEIIFQEMRWARKPDLDKYYLEDLIKHPSQALSVGDVIWIRLIQKGTPWHVILEQEPLIQGALLSIDPHTGFIKAMVGGFDYTKSEFNRSIQGQRQVGSSFKPIIYTAALDKGYTTASVITDSPIIYKEGEEALEEKWKPRNFGERFYGDTILADALAFSRNIITIKLVQDIKIDAVTQMAKKLGIKSPLIEDLSMALGSSSFTLEEMCEAFSVFANEGKRTPPIFIQKVVDREGNVLEEYTPPSSQEQVISPQLAYVITHLLKGVIQFGTAKSVSDMKWALAGKTGTTNDYADAWFMGYGPNILTGVWVGFDERRKMGELETGAKSALPIWRDFMKEALKTYENKDFPIPDKIVFMNVDRKSGKIASRKSKYQSSLPFIEGTEPQEEEKLPKTQKAKMKKEEEEQFFKEEIEQQPIW